jgi:5-formyltetrahydrofolate cyclo-ligase
LLLWFESNGSHRHMRVTLPDSNSAADELLVARRQLRATLRARRRAVPASERLASSQLVAHNVDRWLHLRPGWRVALYAALPQELDAGPLIELARTRGCQLYLPRIDRHTLGRKMRFVRMNDRQRANRLGIMEPEGARTISARWLDVVFVPLLGFDSRGVRLGTGGGFYDRAFAFRRWRTSWHTPRLIGLAYAFQQLEAIAPAAHDVLLDAVVTEKGIVRCTTG